MSAGSALFWHATGTWPLGAHRQLGNLHVMGSPTSALLVSAGLSLSMTGRSIPLVAHRSGMQRAHPEASPPHVVPSALRFRVGPAFGDDLIATARTCSAVRSGHQPAARYSPSTPSAGISRTPCGTTAVSGISATPLIPAVRRKAISRITTLVICASAGRSAGDASNWQHAANVRAEQQICRPFHARRNCPPAESGRVIRAGRPASLGAGRRSGSPP